MNLRDFQYIVAVAKHRNFHQAAQECYVSQSTLSIQIKKLEAYLGVQIFERNNKTVRLTEIGQQICERARVIVDQSNALKELAKSLQDPFAGSLTMGAFPTLAPFLFPLCSQTVKAKFPKLNVQLIEEKTDILITKLENGELDCAFIALPVHSKKLAAIPLFHEPFFLAVNSAHPLATKKTIDDVTLSEIPLLLLEEGHCLTTQALEICHTMLKGESKQFRATSLETLRQMVAMGNGVTLIPKLATQQKDTFIRYIPLKNNKLGRTIAFCYRKTSTRISLFNRLAESIIACTKHSV